MSYVVLINRKTNKTFVLDTVKQRYNRLRGRIRSWVDLVAEKIEKNHYLVMVTLTYRDGVEWQPNHIRNFMLGVRKELGKGNLLGYAWVAELQQRGAVHYHVLLYVKKGKMLGKPDENGLWLHGMSRIEKARTPFYIIKYVSKRYHGLVYPKGLRVFAVWICDNEVARDLRYMSLRLWERELVDTYGWEEYKFWVREVKDQDGWLMWGQYDQEDVANAECKDFEDIWSGKKVFKSMVQDW